MSFFDSVIDLVPDPVFYRGVRLRRRAVNAALESFFRGATALARLHPISWPGREVELLPDIPYLADGSRDHLLDILRPVESSGPRPVVLHIHGGGFRILSKDTHRGVALSFARQGYLVFNINYRLAPRYPFPAAIEDACAAYCWVVERARRYGGDLTRLVLAGESAGANLSAGLALAACFRRPEPYALRVWETEVVPRVVAPICGLLQLSDPERYARAEGGAGLPVWVMDRIMEVCTGYLGDPRPGPEACEMADPLLVLEGADQPLRAFPSFFLAAGTADPLLDDTRRMKVALDRRGVASEARYYAEQPHAFHALIWRPQAKLFWSDLFSFLDRKL